MGTKADNANVRFAPPLIYLGAFMLGIFGGRALDLPGLGLDSNAQLILGIVVMVIGGVVNFAGAGLFLHNRTAIIPYKPASRLVTTGIYRWTRNPMYLGMALLYCAFAILFDSLLALLLLLFVLLVVQTHVIATEEAYLDRTFGDNIALTRHACGVGFERNSRVTVR